MTIVNKILAWLAKNAASVFGVAKVVVKLVKEVITAVINILFPLFPDNGKFETFVLKARGFVNIADGWLEKAQAWLLTIGVPGF